MKPKERGLIPIPDLKKVVTPSDSPAMHPTATNPTNIVRTLADRFSLSRNLPTQNPAMTANPAAVEHRVVIQDCLPTNPILEILAHEGAEARGLKSYITRYKTAEYYANRSAEERATEAFMQAQANKFATTLERARNQVLQAAAAKILSLDREQMFFAMYLHRLEQEELDVRFVERQRKLETPTSVINEKIAAANAKKQRAITHAQNQITRNHSIALAKDQAKIIKAQSKADAVWLKVASAEAAQAEQIQLRGHQRYEENQILVNRELTATNDQNARNEIVIEGRKVAEKREDTVVEDVKAHFTDEKLNQKKKFEK